MNAVPRDPALLRQEEGLMWRRSILAELPLWLSVFTLFALAVLF